MSADPKPVKFWDPSISPPVLRELAPRDAAAVILSLQAMEGEDNDIDPATTYPEMLPIDVVLLMAHDGECFAEHTEANLYPHADDPHDADLDEDGECRICWGRQDHPAPSPAPVWPDGEMRAAIEALPVGTVVRLGHTFPETGNFQGSQYLRTSRGLRYIGPGRDDSDATTLHQQVQMCDDFRVDARPTSGLPDPTADTVLLNKIREIVDKALADPYNITEGCFYPSTAIHKFASTIAALLAGES